MRDCGLTRTSWRRLPGLCLLGWMLALAAGCGSSTVRPSSPLGPEHHVLFDNRIDWVDRPQVLDGEWGERWQEELERRVAESDLIAVVELRALRADEDPEGRKTYRLMVDIREILAGLAPSEELALMTDEREHGYASVRRRGESGLLHQRFAVYVKWYFGEDGALKARWQLAPASEAILQRTRTLIHVLAQQRGSRGAQ